jgi:putative aldouronate transport system permease protein
LARKPTAITAPTAAGAVSMPAPKSTRKRIVITSKTINLWLLFLPVATLLILFNYAPMYGIIIGFKDFSPYTGIFGSPSVGLKHFAYFFGDPKFWQVVRNTLVISALDIFFGFPAPIIFALLANEIVNRPFKRVVQTISYLPHFLSWIVVQGIFYQLLSPTSGLLQHLLVQIFPSYEPIAVLTLTAWFRPIAVTVEIWKGVGWGAILYFATLAGIDPNLYEAAYIDGAGRIRMARHITLPGLLPIIALMFILRLSSFFVVGFERIFVFANPLTYEVSDVLSVYIYRIGLEQAQYSLTTAIGLVQSVLGVLMLYGGNRLASKVAGLGLW